MPNPKRRHSKSRSRMRRAHDALTKTNLVACSNCQRLKLPHRVCPFCGYYAGRQVIEVEE
ncbi:MAG TPA: 50S ribosomal protein L32 [Blastocatellia bacterium]|nr:50S ribosomal protein L32 [Blastocatellia bacterium]